MDIASLRDVTKDDLCKLPRHEFKNVVSQLLEAQAEDRRENELLYYKPVSDLAKKAPTPRASHGPGPISRPTAGNIRRP